MKLQLEIVRNRDDQLDLDVIDQWDVDGLEIMVDGRIAFQMQTKNTKVVARKIDDEPPITRWKIIRDDKVVGSFGFSILQMPFDYPVAWFETKQEAEQALKELDKT